MAVYKVLQDIEGEDHIIGWLTPKQSIYAAIVVVSLALAYVMGRVNFLLAVPWLIPIGFFGFLAAPLGKDQPNDVWAAAQLRFYLKPRKRLWDQSGMQELVQITVPKRIEKIYTDGLSQSEVRSRLGALSTTLDSRGWALKGASVNVAVAPQFSAQFTTSSDDRLVGSEVLTQDLPITDVTDADDILDANNNAVAQRFDTEIKRQEQVHKSQLKKSFASGNIPNAHASLDPAAYEFINRASEQPNVPQNDPAIPAEPLSVFSAQVVAPGSDTQASVAADDNNPDAQALLDKIHHDKEIARDIASHSHERVLKTPQEIAEEDRIRAAALAEEKRRAEQAERHRIADEKARAKTAPDAILKELSQSDLKVSTIAAQAQHKAAASNLDDGEVVISLH